MLKQHDHCLVKGCGKATHGKPYCARHLTAGQRRTLSSDLSILIRSACCGAACTAGKAHENGEQYCTTCNQACCWRVERAA